VKALSVQLELTPSQAPARKSGEGVESRRRAPKAERLRWRRAPDHEPRGLHGSRGRRKPKWRENPPP